MSGCAAATFAMWRFWRVLPPKGKVGILFGNWYTAPIVHRVEGVISGSLRLDHRITLFTRVGNLFAWLCVGTAFVLVALRVTRRSTKRDQETPAT